MDLSEIIPDAAFFIHQDTGIGYDDAYAVATALAQDAVSEGIAFDARMLAEVAIETRA